MFNLKKNKKNKQGKDEFRHNHYPTLNVQLFKFSFKTCPICRIKIVLPTFYTIEAIPTPCSQFS